MISLFNKEHNNENFYLELTRKQFDKEWLSEALRSEFVDINHQDEDGNSFLLKCLKDSKYKAVEWLIENGADTDLKNNDGKSAIHIAIEKNSLPVVKGLLELGKIDLNQRDIDGRSLLQNVVVWGNHKMAKLLINKGANLNNKDHHERDVLYDALDFGDRSFIKYLLSLEVLKLNSVDAIGNSILQHPEAQKNDDIVKDLLIAGVDPTILPPLSESFLFNTILRGEEASEIVDLALENNADANAKTLTGNSLMMEVIKIASELLPSQGNRKKYYLEVAQKMLNHGGDINVVGDKSESMLFNAVRKRDYDIISFLLTGGINPNIQNEHAETPLFEIILDGIKSRELILLLIDYNADPNLKNIDGKTIYELLNEAIIHLFGTKKTTDEIILENINPKGEYLLIIKEILERDESDHNYLDSTGDPLFFKPLLYGYYPLFKLYMNFGLDINTISVSGHNIFYEYILKTFEENDTSNENKLHFENYLSSLISHKVEKNYQDALGWTILHKILTTNCDEQLFKILTHVVLFDYTITDNLGRTVIHNAVWGNKPNIIEIIEKISPHVINQPDNYGILPITYAALLGNKELTLFFINHGSNIHSNKKIAKQAVVKFSPMLKNLQKLTEDIENQSDLDHINTVIEQIKIDFNLQK